MTFRPSPEQQAIIEHPLESIRVVAGAGTGKTTTMAARLAELVKAHGIEPEEALGITFTNKAAEELADRVGIHLGSYAEDGRRVEILTYHGFAHGILREYGALVGVRRDAPVVSTGYTRQLMTDALAASPRPHLDLTARAHRVREVAALASRLGDHLASPADVLGVGDDSPASAPRSDLADALTVYESRKRALGIVDYSDLVALAHRLLVDHPAIADRIRNRYRVVLLDEYQDTNPAQREVLRVIFGNGFPVTAVGDPDQTIYEWRGASLANFARFGAHFPHADGGPAAELELTVNRRSGRDIVDLAERVRSRIGGDGVGRLKSLDGAEPGAIEVARLRTAPDEAEWIAERVLSLHDDDGLAWRDIGILFRRHRQITLIREAMERRGIPVEVAALGGLLAVPEVADLHAWLRVLGRPDDAPAFARLVLGSGYHLGLADLAPVAAWVRSRRRPGHDDEGSGAAVLEAVDRLEDLVGLSPEATRRLARFRDRYRRLLEGAQSLGLSSLCRTILDETDAWLEVEALDDAARLSARLNLYRFLDLAEAWNPLDGVPSLEAFLDYLDVLDEDDSADELDTASVGGEDAVAILTVHRAKGLEWPAVVLPALAHSVFPSTHGALADPLARADQIPHALRLDAEWIDPPSEDDTERKDALRDARDAQEWRTAYVAVTRAKARLITTSAHWYSEKTPRAPSELQLIARDHPASTEMVWVSDAGDSPGLMRLPEDHPEDADTLPGGWLSILGDTLEDANRTREVARLLGVESAYDAQMDQLRITLDGLPEPTPDAPTDDRFRTSVTGLVTLATCPKRFYWSEVDRLPRRPSAAMRRGVDLHRRIEVYNRGSMALDEATDDFYDAPDQPTRRQAESGFTAFAGSRFAQERPRLIEAPFELVIDDAHIAGRIDAVYEPQPRSWEIVDFKSGKRRPDGPQRVQLEAYGLAVTDATFSSEPPEQLRVSFVYLGDGLEVVSEDVDDAWLTDARRHVSHLVSVAQEGVYEPTPSDACRSCDFARFCPQGTEWLEHSSH